MTKSQLEQAQEQHQQGLLNEALKSYQLALEENPKQPDAWHCLAIVCAQLEQYENALNHLDQALKLDPDNATYYNSKGNVLSQLNRLVEATQAYDRAIKFKPDYVVAYTNIANCFYRQQKIENAKKAYKKAIVLHPTFANAHFNYGRLLAELGEFDAAIQELKKTIVLDNKHLSAIGQLAHIFMHQGNYEDAIEYYQKRLVFQPNHANTHHDLGLAFLKDEQYKKAAEHLEKSLELQTTQPEVHYYLATAHLQIGHHQQALANYLRQLEKQPHVDSLYNVGVIYMYRDRHQEAIESFQSVLRLDRQHADSLLNLASIYLKMNKVKEAIAHYELALAIHPNDPEIKHILSALKQQQTPDAAPTEYVSHLFDQYAPYYDQHLSVYLQYKAPQTIYQMVEQERNSDQPYETVLDLGCGTGLCGEWFKPKTQKLIGIDLSEQMLRISRNKKIYDELKNCSVLEALNQYQNIELIVAADVFTYIGDLTEIFAKAKAALKPNGLFAFTVEKTHTKPYILQKNIRYAHSKAYLDPLIKQNNFEILRFDNIELRRQYNKPVDGYLVLLKCHPAA